MMLSISNLAGPIMFALRLALLFFILTSVGCSRGPRPGNKEEAAKSELKNLQDARKKEWSPE